MKTLKEILNESRSPSQISIESTAPEHRMNSEHFEIGGQGHKLLAKHGFTTPTNHGRKGDEYHTPVAAYKNPTTGAIARISKVQGYSGNTDNDAYTVGITHHNFDYDHSTSLGELDLNLQKSNLKYQTRNPSKDGQQ